MEAGGRVRGACRGGFHARVEPGADHQRRLFAGVFASRAPRHGRVRDEVE